MQIRDRIIDFRRVKGGDLRPNPANWRTHNDAQRDAIRGILAEVGFVGAALAVERDGGLMLCDGHLRAETAPDAEIPVLVCDLTDDEVKKVLASLDPLADMAGADPQKLGELLQGISTESPALQGMFEGLADAHEIDLFAPTFEPTSESEQPRLDEQSPVKCPECGHEFAPRS